MAGTAARPCAPVLGLQSCVHPSLSRHGLKVISSGSQHSWAPAWGGHGRHREGVGPSHGAGSLCGTADEIILSSEPPSALS